MDNQKYFIFETEEEAWIADAIISKNIRLEGNILQNWDNPRQRKDGKWIIAKHPLEDMNNKIQNKNIEDYNSNWFDLKEII